jgi:hypothetical protein
MDGTIWLSWCLWRIAGGRVRVNDGPAEAENGLWGRRVCITTARGPRIAKHRGSAVTTAWALEGDREIPLFTVESRSGAKSTGDGARNVIAGFPHGDAEAVDDLGI